MKKTCEVCRLSYTETVETDLGTMCHNCVGLHQNCDSCGDLFHENTMRSHQEYTYCEICFDNLIGYCNDCEETYRRSELDRDGYCIECREPNSNIHEWDYQPRYKFYGKGPLYFGIELEIEFHGQNPDILIAAADQPYFFLKHDGSICEGAEVVSHPASFKWINDNFQNTWEKVLKVRNEGMRSFKTETCGIHIHMSKKAFSKFHLYKFLRFFRENVDFVTKISQRTEGNLNQWSALDSNESICYQAKRGCTEERYVAVNLNPPKTVEIRIFRGNLLDTAFRKNLEFCKALFDFTAKSSCLSLTAVHFHKFVVKNKKQFPNLLIFLLKLEIMKMKRRPTVNGVHRKFPSQREKDKWVIDTENDSKEWVREDSTVPIVDSAVSEARRMDAAPVSCQPEIQEEPTIQEQPIDPVPIAGWANYSHPNRAEAGYRISELRSAFLSHLNDNDQ